MHSHQCIEALVTVGPELDSQATVSFARTQR